MVNLLDEASNVLDALETLMPVPGTTPLDDLEECALKQTALELLNAVRRLEYPHRRLWVCRHCEDGSRRSVQ